MSGQLWFGTKGNMQYVPMPAFNADFSSIGWQAGDQSLNGRARVRSSSASHKVYNMAWNLTDRNSLRPITDYAGGMFGTGPVYFIDPMTADMNVLPEHWAFPGQATLDAPVLVGGDRPIAASTPSNSLMYPSVGAQYTVSGASKTLYIPIPPGQVAWVGIHGSITGSGGLKVRAHLGGLNYAADAYPTMLPVTSETRVDTSFSSASYQGIELSFASTDSAVLTLSGNMVQILPIGVLPQPGGFISGQGHTGCRFQEKPSQTAYSSGLNLAGLSAVLVEVDY